MGGKKNGEKGKADFKRWTAQLEVEIYFDACTVKGRNKFRPPETRVSQNMKCGRKLEAKNKNLPKKWQKRLEGCRKNQRVKGNRWDFFTQIE